MYEIEERETHISTCDTEKHWTIFTRQKRIINRLIKLGYEPLEKEMDKDTIVGAEFQVDLTKISFKKAKDKAPLSEEERAIRAERLRQNLLKSSKNKELAG